MKGLMTISLTLLLVLTLTLTVGCPRDDRDTPPTTSTGAPEPTTPGTTPPPPPPPAEANVRVTEENYDRIDTDMTLQQAAEILGPPSSSEPQMPPTGDPSFTGRATWIGQHETIELRFEGGRVTERRRDEHQR